MRQDVSPALRGVTPRAVRDLLERPTDAPVLSVFFDLDPTSFATAGARDSQLSSLEAHARDIFGDLASADRQNAEAALARVRSYVRSADFPPPGAAGVAIYVSEPDLFEAFALRSPVDPRIDLASGPIVEPLRERLSREPRWGVLLVNRREARLFVGLPDALRERGTVSDEVHGQHKQGGWSAPRFERSVDKEASDHVARSVDALDAMNRRLPLVHIAIGCPSELMGDVERALPKPLRERVAGRIDCDVELASLQEVERVLEPLAAAERADVESRALETLNERIGRGEKAAVGVEEVRSALSARKVERVLCQEGTDLPEDILELALEQDADVMIIHQPMGNGGPLAALLRY